MSRSPAIASAVIAKVQSIDLDTALELAVATGPCDLSPKLWSEVREHYRRMQEQLSKPSLNLLVIRSLDPARTVRFYESLGLVFKEEQHGKGPFHRAAEIDGLLMEVYPANFRSEVDETTRLGFWLDDLRSDLASLRDQGAEVLSNLKPTQWGLRAVVKDPDGRAVELVQG